MRYQANRFVIGCENNVVRVDFSREPDPPAPTFPGACALRETGNRSDDRMQDGIPCGGITSPHIDRGRGRFAGAL